MQKNSGTAMTKPYGKGFDAVTEKADIHAFLDWWNEKSFYPLDQDDAARDDVPVYTMAA